MGHSGRSKDIRHHPATSLEATIMNRVEDVSPDLIWEADAKTLQRTAKGLEREAALTERFGPFATELPQRYRYAAAAIRLHLKQREGEQ